LIHPADRLFDPHAAAPPAIAHTAEHDDRVAHIDQIVDLDVLLVEAFSKALEDSLTPS
jgi:hypothetical protein